jgi:maltose alpha-D-glucosyltransferase/alpha-amylase
MAARRDTWPLPLALLADQVAQGQHRLLARADAVARAAPSGLKTRLHGDLHLAQVLVCRDDYVIIDFGGDTACSFEQRRAKHSALRDVASLLHAFDQARHQALHRAAPGPGDVERLAPAARRWQRRVRAAFIDTYFEVAQAGGLWADGDALSLAHQLLPLFELERALRQLRLEIDNPPDGTTGPLAAMTVLAAMAA